MYAVNMGGRDAVQYRARKTQKRGTPDEASRSFIGLSYGAHCAAKLCCDGGRLLWGRWWHGGIDGSEGRSRTAGNRIRLENHERVGQGDAFNRCVACQSS